MPTLSTKMAALQWNMKERALIVELYFKFQESPARVQAEWRKRFGIHAQCPSRKGIGDLVERFRETGSCADRPRSGRPSDASK